LAATPDIQIIEFVNQFAGRSHAFDILVLSVFRLDSVRHLPFVAFLVWAWFSDTDGTRRRAVFSAVGGYGISILIARTIQNFAPHKPRPALSGDLIFNLPVGGYTNDWSSFPSDTAAQAFALVVGVFLISRRAGVAALLWAIMVVCFTRLYGGFHYPSDLVAGAAIGVYSTLLMQWRRLDPLFGRVEALQVRRPALCAAAAFIILFQMTTHLEDVRRMGGYALQIVRGGDNQEVSSEGE
jgi:undecaprenyl-diphosphatase